MAIVTDGVEEAFDNKCDMGYVFFKAFWRYRTSDAAGSELVLDNAQGLMNTCLLMSESGMDKGQIAAF